MVACVQELVTELRFLIQDFPEQDYNGVKYKKKKDKASLQDVGAIYKLLEHMNLE